MVEKLNLKEAFPTRHILTVEMDGVGNLTRALLALSQEFEDDFRTVSQRGIARKKPGEEFKGVEVIEAFVGIEPPEQK